MAKAARVEAVQANALDYSFNDGSDPGSWSVRVNTSDGTLHSSDDFFTVAATATAITSMT